jgi:hypothetical protein
MDPLEVNYSTLQITNESANRLCLKKAKELVCSPCFLEHHRGHRQIEYLFRVAT